MRLIASHASPTSALHMRRTNKTMRNAVNAVWEKTSVKLDQPDRDQPMSAAEIVEQMPATTVPASYKNRKDMDLGEYLVMMKYLYGEGLTLLTREVAEKLVDKKPVFAIWGASHDFPFRDHVKRTDPHKDMLMLEFVGLLTGDMRRELSALKVPKYLTLSGGYVVRNINPNLPKKSTRGYFDLHYTKWYHNGGNNRETWTELPVKKGTPMFVFLKPSKLTMKRKSRRIF